ncbi:MAG: hypothetical protein PHF17_09850 [Arcobacteraceae bacterium]|nr:hypothetical protein [Arcobacteraceae bacterium]
MIDFKNIILVYANGKIVYKKLMLLGVLFLTEQVLAEEVINPYAVNSTGNTNDKSMFLKYKTYRDFKKHY